MPEGFFDSIKKLRPDAPTPEEIQAQIAVESAAVDTDVVQRADTIESTQQTAESEPLDPGELAAAIDLMEETLEGIDGVRDYDTVNAELDRLHDLYTKLRVRLELHSQSGAKKKLGELFKS